MKLEITSGAGIKYKFSAFCQQCKRLVDEFKQSYEDRHVYLCDACRMRLIRID